MNFLNERKLPLDVPLGALLLLSETRIMRLIRINFCACVPTSTQAQPALTLRNSDSVRRCDGIFKRRVHNSTRAQKSLADTS